MPSNIINTRNEGDAQSDDPAAPSGTWGQIVDSAFAPGTHIASRNTTEPNGLPKHNAGVEPPPTAPRGLDVERD
jgi:hypothetical protein